VTFLYLDTKTETLVKRFSETRRRHPFSSDERTLTEAIEYERDCCRRRASSASRSTRASFPRRRCDVDQGVHFGRSLEAHAAVRVVRLQERRAARRRPRVRRALACRIPTTSRAASADRRDRPSSSSSKRYPKSSGCTRTSITSSRAGCPTTRATIATT
jgi:hypothetical protein